MLTSDLTANSSSFGTGGGGVTFQFRVQVEFFVTMLINGQFPCLEPYKEVKWIKTQGRPKFITDDIDVCVVDLNGKERKFLGQIKHKLTFTKSEEDYQKTLYQAWDDYRGRNFDRNLDVIAIITGPIPTQTAIDTVKPIFDAARASSNIGEFTTKVRESKARIEKYEAIQSIINTYAKEKHFTVSEEDIWRFCQVLHLLSYDYDYVAQSTCKARIISTIQNGLVEEPHYTAEVIYDRLFHLIAEYNLTGATKNRNNLPSDITACFRNYQIRFHKVDPWELPLISDKFVGQALQIAKLKSSLKLVGEREPTVTTTILGTGGIGKTYLAAYLSYHPPHAYKLRVWFDATSHDALNARYKSFAEDVNLPTEQKSPDQIRKLVKHWFQQSSGWLIVYDNVESKTTIESYIPSQGGQIIITSRLKKSPNAIRVDLMTIEDSIAVLKKYADPENNRFNGRASNGIFVSLAETLERLPLALSQAGAYIYAVKIMPERYLELYTTAKRAMMEARELEDHEPTYFTWDVTVADIRSRNAKAEDLLNIIACYNSTLIPRKLIAGFCSSLLEVDDCLAMLDRYSMIELSEQSISLHSVVKDVTLEKQREKATPTHRTFLIRALTLYRQQFRFDRDNSEQLRFCQDVLIHGINLLTLIKGEKIINADVLRFEYEIGLFLLDYMNDVANASKHFEYLYGISDEVEIDEGLYKKISRQLGKTYVRQKRWEEAEELLKNSDLDSVEGLCDLASFYILRQGYMDYPTIAIEELEQDGEFDESEDTNDGPDISQSSIFRQGELTQIRSKQKTLEYQEQARENLEKARSIRGSTLKEEAWIAHLFGTYYVSIRNLEKAREEYTSGYNLKLEEYTSDRYPKGHFEIARTLVQLARTELKIYRKYKEQTELRSVIAHLEEALDIKRRFYQNDARIDIFELLVEIISACDLSNDLQDKEKAKHYIGECLTIKRNGFKEPSRAWGKLGELLVRRGQSQDAMEVVKDSKDALSKKIYDEILRNSRKLDDYLTQPPKSQVRGGDKASSRKITIQEVEAGLDANQERVEEAENFAKEQYKFHATPMTSEEAIAESIKMAEERGKIGPRQLDNWQIKDVLDDGNCFYLAVADQLHIQQHSFVSNVDPTTCTNDSLRLLIQGAAFKDREWTDHEELITLTRKLNIIVAIVDTRHPDTFVYHYIGSDGQSNFTRNIDVLPSIPTIKLAYTGSHYLSVRSHPQLTNCLAWTAPVTSTNIVARLFTAQEGLREGSMILDGSQARLLPAYHASVTEISHSVPGGPNITTQTESIDSLKPPH